MGTYLGWGGGVPTLAGEGVPMLDGGYLFRMGGTYFGWGVPTLAGGYLPWMGRSTYLG